MSCRDGDSAPQAWGHARAPACGRVRLPTLPAMPAKSSLLSGLLALCLGLHAQAASAQEVTVCLDPEPPPASYWVRDARWARTTQLTGFSVDLFREVFKQIGRPVRFVTDLPWARCLRSAAEGKVDFAMDGYYSAERAQTFAFSRSYVSYTPSILSPAARPLRPTRLEDLKGLRGCGMNGASYEHYGLNAKALDTGVHSYAKLLEKLVRNRCDYVPEELEVVVGVKSHGVDFLGGHEVVQAPAPWARAPAKHLLAAKGSAAALLLPDIDRAITRAIQDGSAAALWRRHARDLPYQP